MVLHPRPAESMIETLLAITVIVLTTAAGLSLLRGAVHSNTSSRQELIASHLASEAVDALLNIRDSNYLRFPSDLDLCWDHFAVDTLADCRLNEKAISSDENYVIFRDLNASPLRTWTLVPSSDEYTGQLNLYRLPLGGMSPQYYADAHAVSPDFVLINSAGFTRLIEVLSRDTRSYTADVVVSWEESGQAREYRERVTIPHLY